LEREIAGTEAGCYGRKLPGCFESAEGLCENEFHGTRNATFRSSRPPCRRSSMTADDSQRYRLIGYAVMNDHVHVVVEPSTGHNLTKIVQSWKSYTTNRMQRSCGRKGRVWRGSISTALFGTTRNSATGLPGVALLIRGRLSLPRSAPSRGDWRSDTEHQSSTAFQAWKARHTAFTKVA
jgi:hypothetical protein